MRGSLVLRREYASESLLLEVFRPCGSVPNGFAELWIGRIVHLDATIRILA